MPYNPAIHQTPLVGSVVYFMLRQIGTNYYLNPDDGSFEILTNNRGDFSNPTSHVADGLFASTNTAEILITGGNGAAGYYVVEYYKQLGGSPDGGDTHLADETLYFDGSLSSLYSPAATQQAIRDAMKLAPTAGSPAASSIDETVNEISQALAGDTSMVLAEISADTGFTVTVNDSTHFAISPPPAFLDAYVGSPIRLEQDTDSFDSTILDWDGSVLTISSTPTFTPVTGDLVLSILESLYATFGSADRATLLGAASLAAVINVLTEMVQAKTTQMTFVDGKIDANAEATMTDQNVADIGDQLTARITQRIMPSDVATEGLHRSRIFTLVDTENGLRSETTKTVLVDSPPATYAVDFRNDAAVNQKVFSLDSLTVIEGDELGLEFDQLTRDGGTQGRFRMTVLAAGNYTVRASVTYTNGSGAEGDIFIKAVA